MKSYVKLFTAKDGRNFASRKLEEMINEYVAGCETPVRITSMVTTYKDMDFMISVLVAFEAIE